MTPESQLAQLASKHPLPEGWTACEAVVDRFVADDLVVHRAGLSAIHGGEEVNGAAAGLDAPPVVRAYFELVERAWTIAALRDTSPTLSLRSRRGEKEGCIGRGEVFLESDDPAAWRPARSNGIAVHTDWSEACSRALWELAERDRVLRAWRGELLPFPIDLAADTPLVAGAPRYEWLAYRFPEVRAESFSDGIEVVGIYGFPRQSSLPLVCGYGARPALQAALANALAEATQVLAFLWGEAIPEREPDLPPSAPFHLDYYLVPERHATLRRWLAGGHVALQPAEPVKEGANASLVRFVDLTEERADGIFVAKAICSSALPLAFGRGPSTAHMPADLQVHPIS